MKNKVFMMIAMAFMAIGAEAQKIISEIDWTKEKNYDEQYFCDCMTMSDAMLFYQCGHLPGQHIIKKVQVFKIDPAGTNGNETTINATKTTMSQGTIYNLAGQKVNASYKGLVIQNGKKRIVH